MTKLIEALGIQKFITIIGVVIVSFLFFLYLMLAGASPQMGLLFSQLDPTDGAKIVEKLRLMNIAFTVHEDGAQILVPLDKIAHTRMILAQDGLPSGGVAGYELFDNKDFLGTTSNLIDLNHVRALEGELSRSIKSISIVQGARVHLMLPKKELFSNEQMNSSASVMIKTRGSSRLSANQVTAIQHLIASAVPKLTFDKIAIVDDKGSLLAKGHGEAGNEVLSLQLDMKQAYESRLSRTIESLLEKSLGLGKVRAEVTADIDFDRITSTSIKYDPDGQVAKTTQTTEEGNTNQNAQNNNVSIQEALTGQQDAKGTAKNQSKSNQEVMNFEVSNTTQTHIKEAGSIKRLSVAVLVDGLYLGGDKYQSRSSKEISEISELVKTAIGFDKKRGDVIRVSNLRFEGVETKEEPHFLQSVLTIFEAHIHSIIQYLILGIVALITALKVIRPTIQKLLEPLGVSPDLLNAMDAIKDNNEPVYDEGGYLVERSEVVASQLDLEDIEGRVQGSSIKKIIELINKHPSEAINIMRNWIYTDH